ncbi:MAG: head GIN domain-containing protein [Flavobacteriaceae bacterium]
MMKKIINSILFGGALLLGIFTISAQEKEIDVASFNSVIISPHIEVTFVEGDREMVTIENSDVPFEKININVEGNTLKVYLDGAKSYTKSKKVKHDNYKEYQQLYRGTQLSLTVTYKNLNKLSVRGEENIRLESPIDQKNFDMTIYGESDVLIKSAVVENLKVVMYGQSYLKIESGEAEYQRYKAYGESEVNALGLANKSAKITAYGESEFRVSVSERLKVTSYGESEINYQGNPSIDKGVVLGENRLRKI